MRDVKLTSQAININSVYNSIYNAATKRNVNALREYLSDDYHHTIQKFKDEERGGTLLHCVIGYNGCVSSESIYNAEKCVQLLLDFGIDPNSTDRKNIRPLQLAIANDLENVVMILLKAGSATSHKWVDGKGLIATHLANRMPKVFLGILDRAVSSPSEGKEEIEIDWKPVLQYRETLSKTKDGRAIVKLEHKSSEISFLYSILGSPDDVQRMIFTHPVISLFLYLKSKKYWLKFGGFIMVFQAMYWLLYVGFLLRLYFTDCEYRPTNSSVNDTENTPAECQPSKLSSYLACILAGFLVLYILFEIRKFFVLKIDYFFNWRNVVFDMFAVNVGVTIWPALPFQSSYDMTWQYPLAQVGMFATLVMFLMQVAELPMISTYLEMLFKILSTVLIGCIFFSPLILGFYFGMQLMFSRKMSWFEFLTIFVSDADFDQLVQDTRGNDKFYKSVAYIFVAAFIIVLIFAFLNLILGLAVEHILNIRKWAEISYKKRQVQQMYLADKVWSFNRNKTSIVQVKDLADDSDGYDTVEITDSNWKHKWDWNKIVRPIPIFRWILRSTDWDTLIVEPEKLKLQLVKILRSNDQ